MSRGTNEFVNKNCKSALVSYEFQITAAQVKRYRVEREFKAGEKGTKSGKCRLLDVTDGETVLEESVTGVDRACVEIIGLTADDFMRTVVLPQGKFSEFLKVSGKDRKRNLRAPLSFGGVWCASGGAHRLCNQKRAVRAHKTLRTGGGLRRL